MPPLGTLALADLSHGTPEELRRGWAALHAAPWVPVVLTGLEAHEAPVPARDFPIGALLHRRLPADERLAPERLCSLVRARTVPCAGDLGRRLDQRIGSRVFTELSLELLGESPSRRHRSTLARGLRREQLGGSPAQWRRVLLLARAAGRHDSVDTAAQALGIDGRTLRAACRVLLGCSAREYVERLGWEWVLEGAVRSMVERRRGDVDDAESA